MFHLAELFDLVDFIGEKEHQVFLFELHHLLIQSFIQFNITIYQNRNFAADKVEILNDVFDHLEVELLLALSG